MENKEKARIIKANRGQYIIAFQNREINATLSGKLKFRDEFPVIGDYVDFDETGAGSAVIREIYERKSYLQRPDGGGHADTFVKTYTAQAMVANIDYLFILTSMNDDFSLNRIIRYAVTSVHGGCRPVIILTKADLRKDKDALLKKVIETNSGTHVFCVSSLTGEGLDALRAFLREGVTIAFMGSSGVGKSSLINALAGHEIMKTADIRDKDSKGRHTTTHREMVNVNGAYLIDTPGMREFALCDVEDELNETFEDVISFTRQCRFSNCRHLSEPGCAVKAAIKNGLLSEERFEAYRSLMGESIRIKKKSQVKHSPVNTREKGKTYKNRPK